MYPSDSFFQSNIGSSKCFSPETSRPALGPPDLLLNEYQVSFPEGRPAGA
jgi:hypothetical protein